MLYKNKTYVKMAQKKDLEKSGLLEDIELRKMAVEIDSKPEEYTESETTSDTKVSDSLNPKEIRHNTFEKLREYRFRYYPTYSKPEIVLAQENTDQCPIKRTSDTRTDDPLPSSLTSELVLVVHKNMFGEDYLISDSSCLMEDEVVYKETTKPLKSKAIKKRVNRLFQSCLSSPDRKYSNFGDMYERSRT